MEKKVNAVHETMLIERGNICVCVCTNCFSSDIELSQHERRSYQPSSPSTPPKKKKKCILNVFDGSEDLVSSED